MPFELVNEIFSMISVYILYMDTEKTTICTFEIINIVKRRPHAETRYFHLNIHKKINFRRDPSQMSLGENNTS